MIPAFGGYLLALEDAMYNVLGICGSPVEESNTELLLMEGLKVVKDEGMTVNVFSVQGKKIEDCRHCNWCMAKQTKEKGLETASSDKRRITLE